MTGYINIIKELKSLLLCELGDDIKDVVLHGSQIGTSSKKQDSDYDILVVVKKKYNWPEKRKIRDLCYEISLKYDIIINSKIISAEELESNIIRNHPFYKNALNRGVYA